MEDPVRHCTGLLRSGDRDRYLAVLLAPQPARGGLAALHALDLELSAIPERITEPLAGEVRLQWWRDAIGALCHGAPAEHPVLAALKPAIDSGRLPLEAFQANIDARIFDQYDDAMPDMATFEGYCGERFGVIVRLACLILGAGDDGGAGTAAGHAGMALGMAWVLRGLARHAARGKVYIPADLLARHGIEPQAVTEGRAGMPLAAALAEFRAIAIRHLDAARGEVARLPGAVRPAFAPLGLVAPCVSASARLADPLRGVPEISPFRRQWRLWRAARGAF